MMSCLEFDTPSDEFTGAEEEVEPEVFQGKADEINYKKAIFFYVIMSIQKYS